MVHIFNDRWEQITVHAKVETGRFRTSNDHIPKENFSSVVRDTDNLVRRVAMVGPHASELANALTQLRGIEAARVLVGLKALTKKHSNKALGAVCKAALAHVSFPLRTIRQLLKRGSVGVSNPRHFVTL